MHRHGAIAPQTAPFGVLSLAGCLSALNRLFASDFSEDTMLRLSSIVIAGLLALGTTAQAAPDWDAVAKALGKTGTEMAGGVYPPAVSVQIKG